MQWLYGGQGDIDIAAAYDWPHVPIWVRAMMVMTLDGAISGPDGKSGSISNATDRAIMAQVRRDADVVLIGASTMRAERYSPMKGRPTLAIVSASLDLPWQEPVFTESEHRPIVLTSVDVDGARLETAHAHASVVQLKELSGVNMIDSLSARGLVRVVCEGGARLLGSLTQSGVMDEYDVAISPQLLLSGQVLLDADIAVPERVELVHAIEDSGFVFTKYRTLKDAA